MNYKSLIALGQQAKRNLVLPHIEETTFDRLSIPKLPGQQQMETLSNCFQTNLQSFREAIIGLFALRLCHQLPRYITWRPDPQSIATDAFQKEWKYRFLYAFPPLSMIGRVLREVKKDQSKMMIVKPTWQSQSWYPILFKMTIKNPILLPNHLKVLLSTGEINPPIQNLSLRLAAWLVSSKVYLQERNQKALSTLSQMP